MTLDSPVIFDVEKGKSTTVWSRVSASGAAVASGSLNWATERGGPVNVFLRPSRSLGAGTYNGTLRVEICADAQCVTQIAGSPVNIAVTYVVTGTPGPQTQVSWAGQLNDGHLRTTQTSSPQFKLRVSALYPPYPSLFLRQTSRTGDDIFASVVFGDADGSVNQATLFGEFTITLKPPATLGSGEFFGRIDFEACYDQACTRVVPGSAYAMHVSFLVLATEGVEYVRRELALPQGSTEVIWSSANHSLYVLSNQEPAVGSSIAPDQRLSAVDPITLQIGPSVTIPGGETLRHLTVTPDGTRLYAANRSKPFVHRFTPPGLVNDLTVSLDTDSANPLLVQDFAMLPGQPDSFVVSLTRNVGGAAGFRVYDNALPRAESMTASSPVYYPQWLVPAAVPGAFLTRTLRPTSPATDTLDQLLVDGNGIHAGSSTPLADGMFSLERPQRSGNRLFSGTGRVFDVTTGAQIGTFGRDTSTLTSIVVDEAHGRLFQLRSGFLFSYDLATLEPLAVAKVDIGSAQGLALWGTEGLVAGSYDKLVLLSGPFFSTYRGQPTM